MHQRKATNRSIYYFDVAEEDTPFLFANRLGTLIKENRSCEQPLVLLCIGSDRVTGDSLGPLIGYKLIKKDLTELSIYGTLENPVHALNLNGIVKKIYDVHHHPFIIAVDASLGCQEHLGHISIGKGSISPGSGVNKELPPIGDVFVTGIVNTSGVFEQLMLQTTRLSSVMQIADSISAGIYLASKFFINAGCGIRGIIDSTFAE